MSGGVDSSVAACLLKEQGYDVVGSHMNLVHLDGVEHGCCGPAARADAAEVARIAGFPFEIVDLSDEFAATVIDDFVAEHEAGRTPNPCARCNGEIKFGAFLRRADELGIDLVATGHYVRTGRDDPARGICHRGADPGKDQSYMLHMLGQSQLVAVALPDRRACRSPRRARIAERFGLPVASKPDSQELCFAPVGRRGGVRPIDGAAAGAGRARSSTPRAALGDARRDVRASRSDSAGDWASRTASAAYVVDVDAAANRVVVGPQELLSRRGLRRRPRIVGRGARPARRPFEASVRIRYRGDDVAAVIEPLAGERIRVEFRTPQRAVAPGQSVVIYRGDELLGGGRIVEALR